MGNGDWLLLNFPSEAHNNKENSNLDERYWRINQVGSASNVPSSEHTVGCVIWGIESNAENLENDEAEESEEEQNEKVIDKDKERGGAVIPLILRFGDGFVQFFDLRHCRAERRVEGSDLQRGYCWMTQKLRLRLRAPRKIQNNPTHMPPQLGIVMFCLN